MILPKRIWRNLNEIEGMEEHTDYQVSNTGKVRSLKFGKKKVLKPIVCASGYLQVGLCVNGKVKTFRIHRLVAMAFIPNDDMENKTQINHIDEIKTNNCVENLEWCTREYNNNYGTRTERTAKAKSKKVYCVELDRIFPSTHEASRQLGLAHNSISRCCNGKYKTCGGYHWKYI